MRKISKIIIPAALLLLSAACAVRVPDIAPPPEVPEPAYSFSVYLMHIPFYEDPGENLYRKMLGEWSDILSAAESKKGPSAIAVSGPLVMTLSQYEQEDAEIRLPEHITVTAGELSGDSLRYLQDKYGVEADTAAVVSAQVEEALGFIGETLRETPGVNEIIEKDRFEESDREFLADFLMDSISGFSGRLKAVLDLERVEEASTSLTHSLLPVLGSDRIRAQILESMVNYKRWRDRFPDGFVPRQGHLDAESAAQIERTGVRWVLVSSSEPVIFFTTPQVIPLEARHGPRMTRAEVFSDKEFFKARDMEFISFEDYLELLAPEVSTTTAVRISTSPYIPAELELTPHMESVKGMLEGAASAILEYRDSGRAGARIMSRVQRLLFKAESGEFTEPGIDYETESVFRESLIEIYRAIDRRVPPELFFRMEDPGAVIPERELSALLDITCDGVIDSDEWADGAYLKINSTVSVKWGYDRNNLYAAVISTVPFERAGFLIGHIDAEGAVRYPRLFPETETGFPLFLEAAWRKGSPRRSVIYRTSGDRSWEVLSRHQNTGHENGMLETAIPFRYIDARPGRSIFLKFYIDEKVFPEEKRIEISSPVLEYRRGIISYIDAAGDNKGPGNYRIPDKLEEYSGCFDFRGIEVHEHSDEKIISLEFSDIANPWEAPLGFSPQIIDIYIDVNAREGLGNTSLLEGRRAFTTPVDAWEYCITVSGWDKAIYNAAGRKIGEPQVNVNPVARTINIIIDDSLIPAPVENWGVIPVVLAGDDSGELVEVVNGGDPETEFTGRRHESDTNILDVILPRGHTQRGVLGANRRRGAIEIPALRKR